jgi:hypothetical protein
VVACCDFSRRPSTNVASSAKLYDPESNCIVERANDYPKTSVLPGRRFTIPSNFSHQLSEWLPSASGRAVRHRPFSLQADTATQVQLPRDY